MTLMLDKTLRARIRGNNGPVVGLDPVTLDRTVVGCSVDMHVGDIYRPNRGDEDTGSADRPHQLSVTLMEGETAVVRSLESFRLTPREAALVFPVSSVSVQGLLMTNPGHVDPGYEGHVHVTVINMGRAPFTLKKGDRLLRALILGLDDDVDTVPLPRTTPYVTKELLDKLAPDFLSVDERTTKAAKREIDQAVKQNQLLQYGVPAILAFLGILLSSGLTYCTSNTRFEERIRLLEDIKASNRLTTLEGELKTEQRFRAVEAQLQAWQPASTASSGGRNKAVSP